jgi:hypothetical protein
VTPQRALAAVALLPSLLLGACAAGPASGPRAPGGGAGSVAAEQTNFPSREALAQIAALPVPARLFDGDAKDVPTWELAGPLPDAVERAPFQDDSPWGKLFTEAAATRGDAVVATEAMHCLARENATFYLANGALPAELLERFIAARCGVPTGQAGTAFSVITADERIPDDKIFAQFQAQARVLVDKTLKDGRLEAGLAYLRKGGHAVIALSVTPQTVRLARTPLVPGPDGNVVLQGEVISPALTVRALINRGRYGYAACTVSPAVALPRFTIVCPTLPEDEVAWLSISALPPGRVLGTTVLEMMVWPAGKPGNVYSRLTRSETAAAGASAGDLVQEINRIRAEAKLPPVALAEQESTTASRLAPHYFSSFASGGGDGTADQVALGLLAGWEVGGTVRDGHFVSTWLANASSWSEVVRASIARPMGRQTLLDPAAERVAVGPVAVDHAYGAVFATYSLFDGYRHDRDAGTVADRISAQRVANGVSRLHMVAELSAEAERAAKSVQDGKRAPTQALNDLLQHISERTGRSVRGWAAEATALDRIVMPKELTASPTLTLGIGVAHRRQEGSAWGRFVVLIIADEAAPAPMTARQEGGHEG